MQTFKFMGMSIPFDLGKFVNENGRDPQTLEILGVLCVNIMRTSKVFRQEILDTIKEDKEFREQLKKELLQDLPKEAPKGGKQ